MRSLEEMRPKIVELTDTKLDLSEKIDSLNKALRARDDTIAQLEGSVEELREKHALAEARIRELTTSLERERSSSTENASELQRAYSDIQKELEEARASLFTLETERSELRNMTAQRTQEIDRLTASAQTYADQLASLRTELDERKHAEDDAHGVLERTRAEMEALRAELAAKDDALERLQRSPSPPPPGTPALDAEVLAALRQQHALELSAAQSEIRTLESAVYDAERTALALQRQVGALQDELAHLRAARPAPRADDLRRASFGSVRSGGPARPLSPPSSFEGLSAETRHKRRVSLSMLKARIDSEAAAARASPKLRASALPTVVEPPSAPGTPRAGSPQQQRKTQFLDDSHIFWCHSCRGDLVIL